MAFITVPDPGRKGNAPAPKDLVQVDVVEGRPAVTSLQVANAFGKEHKHVLRDIRAILDQDEDGFGRSNFGQSSYLNDQGREMPMYVMGKDGFILLVMGYTGPDAMAVKKAYIARFNEMEERLRGPLLALPDFSNPALAARAWAEQYEQRQLVEAQRDEAIRTKAQIGSRREATSMAKASAAVRKADRRPWHGQLAVGL